MVKKNTNPKQEILDMEFSEKEPIELTRYKVLVARRECKKNIIIAVLLTAIIAFVAGYIVSDFSHNRVNALSDSNVSLRLENQSLKDELKEVKNQ